MRKNCGIIAGMSNKTIKKIIDGITLRAFAEESTPDGGDGAGGVKTPTVTNFEELIAKARQEEKQKQYGTIEKLKTQNNTLTEQHNNDLLKIADLEKQLKEANDKLTKAGSGDSDEIKTLKDTVKGLEKDKADLENKVQGLEANKPASREDIEKEVREELQAEYEVKAYKAEKMAEFKDDILVPELVFGSTKEEIDASIAQARERSASIRESLGVTQQKPQKRTPKNPANPTVSGAQDKQDAYARLASMDVRSPEYAKLRAELGLK